MISSEEQLQKKIMRGVHVIHALRTLGSPFGLKLGALTLSILGTLSLVSVSDVVANAPEAFNLPALYEFIQGAFLGTELIVQGIVLCGIALLFLLTRDILSQSHPVKVATRS